MVSSPVYKVNIITRVPTQAQQKLDFCNTGRVSGHLDRTAVFRLFTDLKIKWKNMLRWQWDSAKIHFGYGTVDTNLILRNLNHIMPHLHMIERVNRDTYYFS